MTPLYAYSLLPVAAISLLLLFTLLLRVRDHIGVAAYCASVFVWSSALLLSYFPALGSLGSRAAAVGTFVAASYVHATYDFTEIKRHGLVIAAYAVAAALTVVGFFVPGVLYDPVSLSAGPFFWPGMALAVAASVMPLYDLWQERKRANRSRRRAVTLFAVAGVLGYVGAWMNALMLSQGVALPYGMFTVLASLLLLGAVVQDVMPPTDRRLMERSLAYSAVTAFLSAGFLVGVYWLVEDQQFLGGYRLGALFLIFLAAWAFDPVRQEILEFVGRRIEPERVHATDLARKLGVQEERTAQAERLAELGQFTSAIAHEIRNPLGVLAAHLTLLERQHDVDDETIDEMRAQIDRASHFVDDLLAYGRPKPLLMRKIVVADVIELARSHAVMALAEDVGGIAWHIHADRRVRIEADQTQLHQVLVVLFQNAMLADGTRAISVHATNDSGAVTIEVVDDGPGVPDAIVDRLFEPFVTSRKRESNRSGTGLGLAIARGIVERHEGSIGHDRPAEGGARFRVVLPARQPLLAASNSAMEA